MITCTKCEAGIEADYAIGYPGHCDAPGSYVAKAILCGYVAIGCGGVSFLIFHVFLRVIAFAFVLGGLISLMYLPTSRRRCERSGGGVCPSCGHTNEVKWNS